MSLIVAGAIFGEVQVSLFVECAVFAEIQVSLFVAVAAFGEIPNSHQMLGSNLSSNATKSCGIRRRE